MHKTYKPSLIVRIWTIVMLFLPYLFCYRSNPNHLLSVAVFDYMFLTGLILWEM